MQQHYRKAIEVHQLSADGTATQWKHKHNLEIAALLHIRNVPVKQHEATSYQAASQRFQYIIRNWTELNTLGSIGSNTVAGCDMQKNPGACCWVALELQLPLTESPCHTSIISTLSRLSSAFDI